MASDPISRSRLFIFWSLLMQQLTLVLGLTETYCSSENTGSDYPVFVWDLQSLGKCHDHCINGYAFAVVNNKNCWCSNYAPADQVDTSSCDMVCPGYPYENCGSSGGLYGYLALSAKPSGTAGGYTPAATQTNPPLVVMSTAVVVSTAQGNTVYRTEVRTVATTQVNTVVPPPDTETFIQTRTATERVTSVVKHTESATPVTSIERVTVGGGVITHVITSLATAPAAPSSISPIRETTRHGLSNGAVAGITIGCILGAILLGLLLFLLWRRRRNNGNGQGGPSSMRRNTSVLSKVGLLRSSSNSEAQMIQNHKAAGGSISGLNDAYGSAYPVEVAGGMAAANGYGMHSTTYPERSYGGVPNKPPRIQTDFLDTSGGPSSAATAATTDSRRGMRPFFVDQRLNPNALMTQHRNASRSSVGTLEDGKDYSRPLEVKNPDPK